MAQVSWPLGAAAKLICGAPATNPRALRAKTSRRDRPILLEPLIGTPRLLKSEPMKRLRISATCSSLAPKVDHHCGNVSTFRELLDSEHRHPGSGAFDRDFLVGPGVGEILDQIEAG